MNYPFDPKRGLIVVHAEVFGPSGSVVLRLALDTGATGTMMNVAPLPVLAHTLPPSASVDGLLGLDFLRGQVVSIDFRQGIVSLL